MMTALRASSAAASAPIDPTGGLASPVGRTVGGRAARGAGGSAIAGALTAMPRQTDAAIIATAACRTYFELLPLFAMKSHALSSASEPALIAQATASLVDPPLHRRTSASRSLFRAAVSVPSWTCMFRIACRQSSALGLSQAQ